MTVLNDEQSMMVEAARRFVREQIIAPRLDMALDRSAEFPHTIIAAMAEQGLLNLEFPTDIGGAGLSCYDHTLVLEELMASSPQLSRQIIAALAQRLKRMNLTQVAPLS